MFRIKANKIFLCLAVITPLASQAKTVTWAELLDAIAYVESNHGKNQTSELSKNEKTGGWYQIRPVYVRDVNRILKLKKSKLRFKLDDRKDKRKSEKMIKILTTHYIKAYKLPLTAQNIARIHNGGAPGWKKKSTIGYWRKVGTYLTRKEK